MKMKKIEYILMYFLKIILLITVDYIMYFSTINHKNTSYVGYILITSYTADELI